MKVSAEVKIGDGTFEEWLVFFESYEKDRKKYITNEVIERLSDTAAKVTFEIIDLEGLTELSSRADVIKGEKNLQLTTTIK